MRIVVPQALSKASTRTSSITSANSTNNNNTTTTTTTSGKFNFISHSQQTDIKSQKNAKNSISLGLGSKLNLPMISTFFPTDKNSPPTTADLYDQVSTEDGSRAFDDASRLGTDAGLLAASKIRTPFTLILQLGDQLSDPSHQLYGVALSIPVVFKYPAYRLKVYSSYVLCLMTKTPFFSYLYHILEQFDAVTAGLTFEEPIPPEEHIGIPHCPMLRPLHYLVARLKQLQVPLYPFIVPESSSEGGGDKTALDYMQSSHESIALSGGMRCAHKDISVSLVGLTSSSSSSSSSSSAVSEDLIFNRSYYHEYYSKLGIGDPTILQQKTFQHLAEDHDRYPALHESERDKEENHFIMSWALPVLLRYLPLDQIMLALGCAMTEMKIIVRFDDFRVISSIILALTQLLKPLRWCLPVIVILPDELSEFVESPVPIIIGLQKIPEYLSSTERYAVIDPQAKMVYLNAEDNLKANTFYPPHASKLVNYIKGHAEMILKLTKKKQKQQQQQRGGVQIINSSSGDSAGLLSIDLAVGTEENQKLLLAIKSFIDIVHNHMQALLNTAIHIQHESAKTKRFFLGRSKRSSSSKTFPPIFEENGIATGKPPIEPLSKQLLSPKTPEHVPAGIASLAIIGESSSSSSSVEVVTHGGHERYSSSASSSLVESSSAIHTQASSSSSSSSSTTDALSSVMGNKAALTIAGKAKSLNESFLIASKKTAATLADAAKLSVVVDDDLRSSQMKSRHSYPQNKLPPEGEQPVNSHAVSRPPPRNNNSLKHQHSGTGSSNQGADKLLKNAPQSSNVGTKQSDSGKGATNATKPRSPRMNKVTTSSADAIQHTPTEGAVVSVRSPDGLTRNIITTNTTTTTIINQTPPNAVDEHQSEKSSISEKLETASVCSTASSLPALRVVSVP